MNNKNNRKAVKYNKWGYIFLVPFVVIYLAFNFVPLVRTIYNSFFECYKQGFKTIGPNFVGFENYQTLFQNGDLLKYATNTLVIWIVGFIPQILISLLLGSWFSDPSLRLKGQRFFKTVIYLPNLIMASAFSMLFFMLFSDGGPINVILEAVGIGKIRFLTYEWGVRGLIAFMNLIMWFGNTTILLMAGMMGIDTSLFEAAQVDGAKSMQIFTKITLPLLRPILVYTFITSLIGGIQMFDVPQILTSGTGNPVRSSMTLIMYLNRHLYNKNYGMAGALSVILLIVTSILSFAVFKMSTPSDKKENKA